jgi:hypothetical protein
MNCLLHCNSVEKSCLTGSLVLLCYNRWLQPVVMEINPFRTSCRTNLKSQNLITARTSTCGKNHQKKQLPARQEKLKNENTGSTLDSHQ